MAMALLPTSAQASQFSQNLADVWAMPWEGDKWISSTDIDGWGVNSCVSVTYGQSHGDFSPQGWFFTIRTSKTAERQGAGSPNYYGTGRQCMYRQSNSFWTYTRVTAHKGTYLSDIRVEMNT
ncbi:hypothetical protein ACIPYS_37920 [Kitasatospora sp. NPDC089913]|uniref:hypothetical protein n=1 Tax=Kitasatospora sp. NPDC089913 TaxID=3364080 RepID=UPI0038065676